MVGFHRGCSGRLLENGVPAPRNLYFEQPKRGIAGLVPGQLVAIVKGVFGLATSPNLWWMKLSGPGGDVRRKVLRPEAEHHRPLCCSSATRTVT